MNDPITLDTELYRALGGIWSGSRTAISPLEPGTGPLSASQRDRLQQRGLINAQGSPTIRMNTILSVLGEAGIAVELLCITDEQEVQYDQYYASDMSVSVVVKTEGTTTTIFDTTSTTDILSELDANIGPAPASVLDFGADLSFDEARVLAALMDQQRQSAMAMGASPSPDAIPPVVFYAYEVEQILNTYTKNLPSWPVLALVSTMKQAGSLSGDEVGQVLSRLVTGGFLARSGQGYIFQNAVGAYVNTLLQLNYYLMVTVRTLRPDAGVSEEEFECIGFSDGILSLVCRDDDAGTVYIRSMTQDAIMESLRQILSNPRTFVMHLDLSTENGSPIPPSSPEPSPPSGSFCPACGAPVTPDAKFCGSCGAALTPPAGPPTCPRCGEEVREGAKFCNKCGQKLG
jgi:hypothetical protein